MKYLLIFLTILAFGLSSLFRKLAVDRIHPYQLQIVAGAVYALEIPIWLYLLSKSQISNYNLSGVFWGIVCIATHVVGAVMFGILLKSSNDTGALTLMISINPVITTLFSVMFLQEQFGTNKIIASVIMLIGLILFNLK